MSQVWGNMSKYHKCHKWKAKVAQSCPVLCDPVDYTVHGILQARILQWVAYSFSKQIFPTQEYEPGSPALQADSLPTELWGKLNATRPHHSNPMRPHHESQVLGKGISTLILGWGTRCIFRLGGVRRLGGVLLVGVWSMWAWQEWQGMHKYPLGVKMALWKHLFWAAGAQGSSLYLGPRLKGVSLNSDPATE